MILLYTCILYVVCTFSLFSFSAKPSRLMTGINLSLWVKSIFFCFQFVIVKKGHLVPFWPRFFHFPFSPLLITSVFHRFSLAFFFPLYWKRKKKKTEHSTLSFFTTIFCFHLQCLERLPTRLPQGISVLKSLLTCVSTYLYS